MKSFFKSFFYGIFYIVLFCIVFVVTIPKDKVYYTLLEELATHDIKVVAKDESFGMLDIRLNDLKVYISGSQVASIGSVKISPIKVEVKKIAFENSFKTMVPNIKTVTLLPKLKNCALVSGNFGMIRTSCDISANKFITLANISNKTINQYKSLFALFKKTPKGYRYEYSF